MKIHYDSRTDLLYLRLDDEAQPVVNRRVSEDIVLDIGVDDKLVGIEILDASLPHTPKKQSLSSGFWEQTGRHSGSHPFGNPSDSGLRERMTCLD